MQTFFEVLVNLGYWSGRWAIFYRYRCTLFKYNLCPEAAKLSSISRRLWRWRSQCLRRSAFRNILSRSIMFMHWTHRFAVLAEERFLVSPVILSSVLKKSSFCSTLSMLVIPDRNWCMRSVNYLTSWLCVADVVTGSVFAAASSKVSSSSPWLVWCASEFPSGSGISRTFAAIRVEGSIHNEMTSNSPRHSSLWHVADCCLHWSVAAHLQSQNLS